VKILHICAGWQKWNGAANIARMIMDEQQREGHEVSFGTWAKVRDLRAADEVWIHCGWLPCLWWAALWARNARWMPEACYDPIRLKFSAWKKRLVGPIERWALRRCAKIVATCDTEKEWIEAYLGKRCPEIEVTDIKRFFDLNRVERVETCRGEGCFGRVDGDGLEFQVSGSGSERYESNSQLITHNSQLNLLYLGRRHPLKGVEYLETAVRQLQNSTRSTRSTRLKIELKIVSNAFGEELEKIWDWCDVLVLPTLSENFGLVVAEALERGKRVITTDGAPVWGEGVSRVERVETCRVGRDGNLSRVERVETCREGEIMVGYGGRLIYLKGYREGTKETRVELLKAAIEVVGDGNLSRVERVETCRVGGDGNLSRVERVETCRVGGGW